MALQVCTNCGTAYAPAGACPQCGANHWVAEEDAQAVYDHLNEGDHESVSPANPLGIEVHTGDSQEGNAAATAELNAADTGAVASGKEASGPQNGEGDKGADVSVADIRAWAKDEGLDVADSGALPQFVVDAYNEAHK